MLASGFAALAYQVLWVQQASLWLGQESAAVIAVVAAFFGGLALGSLAAARVVAATDNPARVYAACEVALAAWSLVLLGLLQPIAELISGLVGVEASPLRQWSVAFGGTLLVLLPGTVAMGATLPAMEHALRGRGHERDFGLLYAANTAGAMLGALTAAFWLIPHWGLARTALCCVLLNLACAAAALGLPAAGYDASPPRPKLQVAGPRLGLLFATGLLGIGFELAIVRALSQLAQNTVYTFAVLLAVYLAGTALGAAAHARFVAGRSRPAAIMTALLCSLALATLVVLLPLAGAETVHAALAALLPAGVGGALAAEAALALLVFLPATVVMGLTFTQLVTEARSAGISPGAALAANTLGGAIAAPVLGVALLPAWGLRGVLFAIAAGYLLLGALLAVRAVPRSRWVWATAGALAAALFAGPHLELTTLPPGGSLLAHWEGRMAAVAIVEDARGGRTLHIDNRQQEGSNTSTYADARQALLPLLLHPDPQHALFLGVGTGVTATSATLDPGLMVDAVELVPEVLEALPWFAAAVPEGTDPARIRFISADARRFVRESSRSYDLIVADNFHPARSGTGALYSREHFAQVRRRLAPQGVFCQWLPLHQLDEDSLRSVIRSFVEVYPDAVAILATYGLDTPTLGLVAHAGGGGVRMEDLHERIAALPLPVRRAFDVMDELAVLGTVVADAKSLRAYAQDIPANTDDLPFVAYRAPYETYAPQSLPRDRLIALLGTLQANASEVFHAADGAADWTRRLERYWTARNRYLQIGRGIRQVNDLPAMLAQVREPLLTVLRISPEFRPAYDPLLRMAATLLSADPADARQLLTALATAQPGRTEAQDLLHQGN